MTESGRSVYPVNILVFRLRSETKIRLDSAETREQLLCLLVVDRRMNNDVVLWLPKLATHFPRLWSVPSSQWG